MINIIDVDSLDNLIGHNLRILDVRYKLGGKEPNWGKESFEKGHIPGAVFFDLNQNLSAKIQKHGGRHPLVEIDKFAEQLGQAGINNDNKVVIYDDNAGAFAGRAWWMLKYIDHNDVVVLDGGYSAWLEAGKKIEQDVQKYKKTEYKINIKKDILVDMEYVKSKTSDSKVVILDARAYPRYQGLNEHLDPKAGHIPSALSYSYTENLNNTKFKTKTELKKRFDNFNKEQEIILYCGSGVTACHNYLVLDSLGYKNLKLYIGSWSDWVSYPDNPIETGA